MLSLTAAIALIIKINDWRQGVGPAVQLARHAVEMPAAGQLDVHRTTTGPTAI